MITICGGVVVVDGGIEDEVDDVIGAIVDGFSVVVVEGVEGVEVEEEEEGSSASSCNSHASHCYFSRGLKDQYKMETVEFHDDDNTFEGKLYPLLSPLSLEE